MGIDDQSRDLLELMLCWQNSDNPRIVTCYEISHYFLKQQEKY